jgi:hypothetical protein
VTSPAGRRNRQPANAVRRSTSTPAATGPNLPFQLRRSRGSRVQVRDHHVRCAHTARDACRIGRVAGVQFDRAGVPLVIMGLVSPDVPREFTVARAHRLVVATGEGMVDQTVRSTHPDTCRGREWRIQGRALAWRCNCGRSGRAVTEVTSRSRVARLSHGPMIRRCARSRQPNANSLLVR